MENILLAGATGYLGSHIARLLNSEGHRVRAVVRDPAKLQRMNIVVSKALEAEVTQPETLEGCCEDIDVVISTVGITRQKDSLTYMDVDYQANMNLLQQAKQSGVRKFIYVSVLNGEKLRQLKICHAKEKFVDQLKRSGLAYCIIRPNGFFSDMTDLYRMAQKGRVYLFGDGSHRVNPIHGEDLATVCVDAIEQSAHEIEVGGPETLTHREIAEIAFDVLGKQPKISCIPDWVRVAILRVIRWLTGSKSYGPIEFFMTVMAMDMLAPEYGMHTLKSYFSNLNDQDA